MTTVSVLEIKTTTSISEYMAKERSRIDKTNTSHSKINLKIVADDHNCTSYLVWFSAYSIITDLGAGNSLDFRLFRYGING